MVKFSFRRPSDASYALGIFDAKTGRIIE